LVERVRAGYRYDQDAFTDQHDDAFGHAVAVAVAGHAVAVAGHAVAVAGHAVAVVGHLGAELFQGGGPRRSGGGDHPDIPVQCEARRRRTHGGARGVGVQQLARLDAEVVERVPRRLGRHRQGVLCFATARRRDQNLFGRPPLYPGHGSRAPRR